MVRRWAQHVAEHSGTPSSADAPATDRHPPLRPCQWQARWCGQTREGCALQKQGKRVGGWDGVGWDGLSYAAGSTYATDGRSCPTAGPRTELLQEPGHRVAVGHGRQVDVVAVVEALLERKNL